MVEMTPETAAILRKQFPPEQIGKLPRSGIQLDYVGHADVTSRLIEADPEWTWEPLATDQQGMPVYDLAGNGNPVGLWIKLTIAGVTRLGYGSVPDNQRDAVKVLIGDALRNAAMRFGVAVDLWAKGDRADPTADNPSGPAGKVARIAAQERHPANVRKLPDRSPAPGTETDRMINLQILVKNAKEAKTLDSLRTVWTEVGNMGLLNESLAKVGISPDMTFMELLYERSSELDPKRGDETGDNGTAGNGAAAPKAANRVGRK